MAIFRPSLDSSRCCARSVPEIVHAHFPKAGFLGLLGATLARVPVRIYQLRGLLLESSTGARRSLLGLVERASCAMAHHVICNSESLRRAAIAARVCAAEKLNVLLSGSSNGVDAKERFNPDRFSVGAREQLRTELGVPNDALLITFAGRVVRDKGIEDLLNAWQELRSCFGSARLLLVGPIETGDAISEAARDAISTDPRIISAGFRSDMPEVYAASDILVLPSYREGFPNVLLEAASMRVPVVATRVTGCTDAVADGVTGRLVAPKRPDELASALATYLGDARLRAQHGEAGRERTLRLFDRERLWSELESTYRRLLRAE